jgi:hypothetical protein
VTWAHIHGKESINAMKALAVNPAPGLQAERLIALVREQIAANRAWANAQDAQEAALGAAGPGVDADVLARDERLRDQAVSADVSVTLEYAVC